MCYRLLEQPQGDPLENPPFSMTYGLEVVIPTKVRMPISMTNDFEQKSNDLTLSKKLDMVEEIERLQ